MKVTLQEGEGWRRSSTHELTDKGIFLFMFKDDEVKKGILITKTGKDEITITVPIANPMKRDKFLDLQVEIITEKDAMGKDKTFI